MESDENEIRLYILGLVWGLLLMQRKIFPLHGSAIAINGKAYAFIGDSGAGKSTLASAFLSKGYQLLSDDVIAVSLSNDTCSVCFSSLSATKAMAGKLKHLEWKTSHYRPFI